MTRRMSIPFALAILAAAATQAGAQHHRANSNAYNNFMKQQQQQAAAAAKAEAAYEKEMARQFQAFMRLSNAEQMVYRKRAVAAAAHRKAMIERYQESKKNHPASSHSTASASTHPSLDKIEKEGAETEKASEAKETPKKK